MIYTVNFRESEFLVSDYYPLVASNMFLSKQKRLNLIFLTEIILQPLRNKFYTIAISSGYRSKKLNRLVSGEKDSDHIHGIAADIIPLWADLKEVFDYSVKNFGDVAREIILHDDFMHISVNVPGRKIKRLVLDVR